MKTISTTEEGPVMKFTEQNNSHPFRAPSNKIGWLTAKSNKPGATFDISIKDAAGGLRKQMLGCGGKEGNQYGEMINMDTIIGEDFEVSVENIKGADEVDVFIN